MKVRNMKSNKGNPVPNQFIIEGESGIEYFQSYNSIIVLKTPMNYNNKSQWEEKGIVFESNKIYLDRTTWDYSTTTGKYRNQFLNEGIAETRKKIKLGEYALANLN